MKRLPSPALLISCLALTIALSGVGYAAKALPRNSVGTKQLKANAVTSAKVKNGSIQAADLAPGLVPPSKAIMRTRAAGVSFSVTSATILTATAVPAGSYIAIFRGDVVNFDTSATAFAYMRCSLESPPGTAFAGGTTFAHDDPGASDAHGEIIVNQMTIMGVLTLAAPTDVRVRCSNDNNASAYIEGNRLLLIPVKTIDEQAVTG